MIMDTLGALALATEPPNNDLMKREPVGRTGKFITNVMWRNIFGQSAYQFVVMWYLQTQGKTFFGLEGSNTDIVLNTIIFNSFVFCQGHPSGNNWEDHNPNSSNRVDMTREEHRMQRINDLRLHGVPERELSIRFVVPEDGTQGPKIDPLVAESSSQLTMWTWKRHEFFNLVIFGDGGKQCERYKASINEFIEVQIKPRVMELARQVIALRGKPMLPPTFYGPPLDPKKLPSASFSVKGKGKGKQ